MSIEFINNELDIEPKTFSAVVSNDDILQMYLKEIGKKKVLTKWEETELGRLIREGAFEEKEIIKKRAHLPLGGSAEKDSDLPQRKDSLCL
jgi:hypothetical protein